ncbi:class F sortase [Streptomyces flavofungini]|uniref:class F sortase n=1 Tax=Streptomyces flavofungini TaxID=68200 RepID=UPI0025AF2653|nr:class F sortase [Streptomyces flavofungini]WJV44120.1 class F sortase [Streptomyces flavofungini]
MADPTGAWWGRMLRSHWFVVGAALSAALATGLFFVLMPSGDQLPDEFGQRTGAEGSPAPREWGPVDVRSSDSPATTGSPPAAGEPVRPSGGGGRIGPADGTKDTEAPPTRVRMPRLEVSARLRAVGVDSDGRAEVPADPGTAGWYRYGPAPGDPSGSAVLVGHVDSRTGDLGAFAALYDVRAGDDVIVDRGAAAPVRYRVSARQIVPKKELPDEVFRRDGRPVLTLITCAAPFDRARGGYQKNLVVTAEPTSRD